MAIDLLKITELVSGGPRILIQMGLTSKLRLIKNIILYQVKKYLILDSIKGKLQQRPTFKINL